MEDNQLVSVKSVGKIFCRDLKRSLLYGGKDIASTLLPGLTRPIGNDGEPVLRTAEFWANREVSFDLYQGECLGIIGHNGAGKTTLLKMLNGLLRPDEGEIKIRGRIGALIALGAGFNPILTGRENVYINGSVLGMSKVEIDAAFDSIVDFAELHDFIDTPVQNYSSGMQVRLGFAVAVSFKADLVLLDEVLAVGDSRFQAKCFNVLSEFLGEGASFIMVSHNIRHILRHCTKVLYLRKGRPQFYGDTLTAVRLYEQEMALGGDTDEEIFSDEFSNGSGLVRFTGATLYNSEGEDVREIDSKSKTKLRLYYRSELERLNNPSYIDFVMRDRGDEFFNYNTLHNGLELQTIGKRGYVEFDFPNIPANNRDLALSFAWFDAKTQELFDWRQNFVIRVASNHSGQGAVCIDCQTRFERLDK